MISLTHHWFLRYIIIKGTPRKFAQSSLERRGTVSAVSVEKGKENKEKESRKYHRSLRSSSYCWFVSLSQSSSSKS